MKLFDSVLSVLAPHDCIGCMAEGHLVCASCRHTIAPALARCYKCQVAGGSFATCVVCRSTAPLKSVMVATKYEGIPKDLLWKLKFGRTRSAATEMADIMESRLRLRRLFDGHPQIILTHAPTATSRVRQRGYDQAELIARRLARTSRVPYRPLLGRIGHQEQVGASKAVRASQLARAFRAIQPRHIRGAHIILVDDVITTGATLESAARTLLDAGARRVDAVVFAQA